MLGTDYGLGPNMDMDRDAESQLCDVVPNGDTRRKTLKFLVT